MAADGAECWGRTNQGELGDGDDNHAVRDADRNEWPYGCSLGCRGQQRACAIVKDARFAGWGRGTAPAELTESSMTPARGRWSSGAIEFVRPGAVSLRAARQSTGAVLAECSIRSEDGSRDNVFDEARDKIAEIMFRVDKDRAGRKFLAVKDQNTLKKYRSRRLMSLMHFFLLHRYKTDLVHYLTPTDDNRLSVRRMIHNGVFREARTDDPNVIAIEVDTARAQKIFANDESIKQFIARQFGPLETHSTGRAIKPAVA